MLTFGTLCMTSEITLNSISESISKPDLKEHPSEPFIFLRSRLPPSQLQTYAVS